MLPRIKRNHPQKALYVYQFNLLGKTAVAKPSSCLQSTMCKIQPQPVTLFSINLPVIPWSISPIGIVQPPFRCDPLRSQRAGACKITTAPTECCGYSRSFFCHHRLWLKQDQWAGLQSLRPVICPLRPCCSEHLRTFFRQMAFSRVSSGDRIQSNTGTQTSNKIIKRRTFC